MQGGTDFLISLKEELPEHIQYRYAYFGNEQVALTKLNKLTLEGTTPGNHASVMFSCKYDKLFIWTSHFDLDFHCSCIDPNKTSI